MSNGHNITVRKRQTTVNNKHYKYWLVDCGMVEGKLITKQFRHESDAQTYAVKTRIQKRKLDEMAFSLSSEQRNDTTKAISILKQRAPLEQAAEFYIAHTDLLYNHYRNLVHHQEAEKYWNIKPARKEK